MSVFDRDYLDKWIREMRLLIILLIILLIYFIKCLFNYENILYTVTCA